MQGKLKIVFVLALLSAFDGCDILSSKSEQLPNPAATTYEYWMTGGYAGSTTHLQIDSSGSAKLTSSVGSQTHPDTFIYRLTASETDTLRDLFQASDFFSLQDLYERPTTIMDGFNFRISCNTPSTSKSVSIRYYPELPPGLGSLLSYFNRISERVTEKGYRL